MRLPRFEYKRPDTLDETLQLLFRYVDDAKILAGGTDLLVRMKKGLLAPKVLISLTALNELSYVEKDKDRIRIGAKTPIADLVASDVIKRHAPALLQACEKIGAVTIQHYRGTIGGNLIQDNRCHHYNQSAFHRSGRQACHKDGGKICYARDEADRCNSTCQSDGATALMALNAQIVLISKQGERKVALENFYTNDGIMVFAMASHELVKEIVIPMNGNNSAYTRIAYRSAIDYPVACAGVSLSISGKASDEIESARIVVGAMGRSPLFMGGASSSLAGKKLTDASAFAKAAKSAMDSAATFAVHNVGSTLSYRCEMVAHLVETALKNAADIKGV